MADVSAAESLFFAALELKTAEERAAFLDTACGDPELRRQVQKLLDADPSAGDFLQTPIAALLAGGPEHLDTIQGCDISTDGQHREAITLDFLQASTRPESLGRIGSYEMLEVVGRGGFGIVFRAFDEKLRREVAVKVLAPQRAIASPGYKRFLREAQSSAKVRHTNIVQVYAIEEQPLPFLVMEFIVGETLQQQLDRRGALDVATVLHFGRQIAEALAAFHAQGLIHRDIKPSNILIENGAEQRVAITDFGLARVVDDAHLTHSGVVAGTPMFMAPEQVLCEPLDYRADMFSLGSVLYAMCTGRAPFRARSTFEVLKRVTEGTPQPIREINPEVPSWLCEIIDRLFIKKPAERLTTAREVADLFGYGLAELKPPLRIPPYALLEPAVQEKMPPTEVGAPAQAAESSGQPPVRGARVQGYRGRMTAFVLVLLGVLGITEAMGVTNLCRIARRQFGPRETVVVRQESPPVAPGDRGTVDALAWERSVAELPAAEQLAAVVARLKELNPGYDGNVVPAYQDGVVTGLDIHSDLVTNISPVRALAQLRVLGIMASPQGRASFRDLTPLQGLKLTGIYLYNTQVHDLTPLQGMRLEMLNIATTPVTDLSALRTMRVTRLYINGTRVHDLTPLKGIGIEVLDCSHSAVTDLSPLRGADLHWLKCRSMPVGFDLSPLKDVPLGYLSCDFEQGRDAEVLRSIRTLELINDKPVAEFWKAVDGQQDR